jgi:hypothetical protein
LRTLQTGGATEEVTEGVDAGDFIMKNSNDEDDDVMLCYGAPSTHPSAP